MQRKRTARDVYFTDSVDMGTSALPVARMRKFAMKNLVKLCVVVIIGFIGYSMYSKNNMAPHSDVDTMSIYDDAVVVRSKNTEPKHTESKHRKSPENEDKPSPDRNIKERVNKVFEEFRQKQEEKQKQDQLMKDMLEGRVDIGNDRNEVVEDKHVDNNNVNVDMNVNNDENNDNVNVFDNNKNEDVGNVGMDDFGNDNDEDYEDPIMQAIENLDDEEDIDEEFEEVNEEEEKEERQLDAEIEELLAGAFGDAKKQVAEANKEIVAEVAKKEEEAKHGVDPNAPDKQINAPENIELKKIIEHLEFNLAVDNMGRRLHPLEVQRVNRDVKREALRNDLDHEFPHLVTAVRQTTIDQVRQLIASVHHNLPGRKLYIYDLDLLEEQKKELIAICGVRLKYFMKGLFPDFVGDLDNLHWKPLVMQTALAEFGHIFWINPGYTLVSSELAPLVHESHEQGILVLGQTASYTTFAATHPDMLKFIATDMDKLKKEPHVEIRAVLIHNTQEVHDSIMKIFTACALETSCLAPPDAKWTCKFDFTGKRYAECHRYDESALNILIKNYFNHDTLRFTRRNTYFRNYDKNYRPKLKQCRKIKDIKPNEL